MTNLIFKQLGFKVVKLTEYLATTFSLKGKYMQHSFYSCILPGKEIVLAIIQPSDFVPATEILYLANSGYSDALLPSLNTEFGEETKVVLKPDLFQYSETKAGNSVEILCDFLEKNSFYPIQY